MSTSQSEQRLRIDLLGSASWHREGNSGRLKPKDAALIAYLAIKGVQERDFVAQLFWPGIDLAMAATNLRQRVSRLRRDTAHPLFVAGASVGLADGVSIDLHDPLAELAVDMLLARGELLAGCDYADLLRVDRWVDQERRQWRRRLADALTGHAAQMEKRGELAAALALGERIVALVPVHEIAWRRQMRLHYLRGDRAAALDAFERFEKHVGEELGMRPSDETIELLQTIERAAAPPPQRAVLPAGLVRPPVLVGRETQWEAMARAWAAGRPFLLRGEAGIGKTRLLSDYLHGTAGVAHAEGRPGDEHAPYAVLARLLRAVMRAHRVAPDAFTRHELARILPEIATLAATSAGQQATLWLAMENLLSDAVNAGLGALAIDDLQFADEASIEALRWLTSSRALAGLRFGLATRPLQRPTLKTLFDDWLVDSQRPEPIDLAPLSRPEVGSLIESLCVRELDAARLADTLFTHAGGHPFLSLETMKDLVLRRPDARGDVLPMPTTVQPLLERRLNALAPPASDVLRVAAIMGSDLTPPRVATVLQRSLAEVQAGLAALESANVFQGLAFIHDLLRECALQRTAPAERVALHGAVAQVLSGDPQVPPGRLAFHWEAAERWPEAGAALYAAGLAARLAGRLEEQRSLLLRSAECWQRVGNRSAEFESRHASMESVLVRQGPTAVLEELPSLQAIAVTPEQELKLLILRAEALVHLMRRDEALQVSTEAVRRGEQHPSLLADALGIHGMVLAQCGRLDEAVEAEQRAADCAQRSGTAPQAIRVTHTQVYVLYEAGRIGEAIAAARTSARLTRESGDVGETAQVEGNLSTLLALAGDPAGCYEMARRVRAQHQAMGSTTNSILGGMNLLSLGSSAAYLGRFDEALDALTAGVQMLGDGTPIAARTKARVVMANLWLTLGAPEQAAGVLPQLSVDVPPAMQVQWHWAQARIEAMAGRPAEPHLRRMGEIQDANTSLPLVQSAWLEWSRQGDAAMVIDRLRPIRSECERLGLPGTARSLLLREIDRLTEIDSDDAVAQAVRLAASLRDTLAQGMHATTYVPEAWAILARAFENAGQRGDGAACSDEGRHWIEACVRDHLPASVKESFLDRNPVNRALMRAQPAVTP